MYGPIVLFVSMTIIGATTIWVGKLYDVDIRIVTAVPIILMLGYFLLNMLPGVRVHNEQAGDNLYYMGFIFTLASLGISLYRFTGQASIEDVVRNFGIAILSTITGIALRIFFNQMRRDPADMETAVRVELSEMTRRVRNELDTSALEFSSYRRTSNQMLSEGFQEIARQAEKNGEAVRASIEAMSLNATQTIQTTSERLMATLDQAHRHVADLAERNAVSVAEMTLRMEKSLNDVVARADALSSTMDTLASKYSTARSPEEVLRLDVAPAVEALKSLVDNNVSAIAANTTAARDTAKKVIAALGPFKQVSAQLTSLSADIKASTVASGTSTDAVNLALVQIGEVATAVRSVVEMDRFSTGRSDTAFHAWSADHAMNREPPTEYARTDPFMTPSADSSATTPASEASISDGERDGSASVPNDAVDNSVAAEVRPDRPRWSLWNR
ncbi:methyl-accepting chemotaxis protein [Rhizobium sp. PP-CC-3G-465]|uniref:methyl-accepting chemotaxis protein n=1 Tax=Rhizobium sp. PP-CC-3G-465 TaxID=2135648 RepID=UPI001052CB31